MALHGLPEVKGFPMVRGGAAGRREHGRCVWLLGGAHPPADASPGMDGLGSPVASIPLRMK